GSITGAVLNNLGDENEAGITGWTVYLDANGDGLLDDDEPTAVTGAGGVFTFSNVIPGNYEVRLDIDADYDLLVPEVGLFEAAVLPGGTLSDLFFGVSITPGSITGIKFNDLNGDGIQNGDEAGAEGWTIFIDANNNGEL